jgi:diguanylate cyclase (GGDEF)-like protein
MKAANPIAALGSMDPGIQPYVDLGESARTKDALTGALTRPVFLGACEAARPRATRYGHSLTVFAFELDRYDEITGSLGQTVGDMMMKALASLLRAAKRPHDVLGRTTRSSFAVFVTGLSGPETLAFATRIQRQVSLLTNSSSLVYRRMTVSVGVAHCRRSVTKLQELVRHADEALGTAKAKGQGRIEYRGSA